MGRSDSDRGKRMILIAWGGIALIIAAVVLSIRARRTIWGRATGPAVAGATRPNGTILLITGAYQWTIPLPAAGLRRVSGGLDE